MPNNVGRRREIKPLAPMPLKSSLVSSLPAIFAVFFPLLAPAQMRSSGSITGTVIGEDGTRAPVDLVLSSLSGAIEPRRTTPSASGAFTFPSLPRGRYMICTAGSTRSKYLDPCFWNAPPPLFDVADDEALTGISIVMKIGIAVRVRVADVDKQLDKAGTAKTATPDVMVMFRTPSMLLRTAVVVSQDTAGREYEAVVPADADAVLYLAGKNVALADANGRPLDVNGTSISLARSTVASATASNPVVINATKAKP